MDDDSEGEEYETEVNDDNGIPEGEKMTEDCQTQGSHIDTTQSGPKLPPEQMESAPKLCQSTHTNKGVPPLCPDKDPKLELGSRTPKSKTPRLTKENRQAEGPTPGGAGDGISAETGLSHQVINDDIGSAFLTADAP